MSIVIGEAKAHNQFDFPLSITLDNVTVEIESYENNKAFDCSGCVYLRDNEICDHQKEISLGTNPQERLRAVALIAHIINASESDIHAYASAWKVVDSQGYSYDGTGICGRFYSRRLQHANTVLSHTQSRSLILFPELEDGVVPSLFILKTGQLEFRFEVAELSESVRFLLKPPTPQDSVLEKVRAYIKSDSYCRFIRKIQEKQLEFKQATMDFVVANLASNYYGFVGNSNNVWENEKQLLEYYPFIVSLAEICTFDFAEKTIITIPNRALAECESIIQKYGVSYEVYPIQIFGHNITAITFFQAFSSDDEMRRDDSDRICLKIWQEIESSKIKCGVCTLSKNKYNTLKPDYIFLSGYRELDLSEIGRGANAGYREDLDEAFRSSWEANVARVLQLLKKKYEYETHTFEMKKYNYLPDFTLEDGTILEVKGVWDIESLGKVKELHQTYPDLKIIAVDSEMYYDIDRKYSQLPNWEKSSISIHNNTVPVVGLSFVQDQSVFETLEIGERVLLVREPNNKYDNYAILATSLEGKPIGHISAEWAVVYAPKIDAGVEYEAVIREMSPKVIRIELARINLDQEVLYSCFEAR